jgi:RNA polymerase sigma-70 factor (ECF subfamily)
MLSVLMAIEAGHRPVPPPGRAEEDLATLLARTATGDQHALARIYDLTSRLVYGVVLRIVGNPADAEEVTLDVFSQVWRSAADYSPGRASPATWLILLARSRALDFVRSRTTRQRRETPLDPEIDPPSEAGSAEQAAWMRERRTIVRRAMGSLQPEQRQLIELSFFEGLTHSQLAERLDQPLGTIKTRIRSGLTKLRQTLAGGSEVAS